MPEEKRQPVARQGKRFSLPLTWFSPWGKAWVASIVLSAILGVGVLPLMLKQAPADSASVAVESADVIYETRLGEQARAVLNDGSIMTLNTSSQAVVDFDENERKVYLESGEALFEVAKNKSRPFRVYAANGRITAVGTAFSVRIDKGRVDVAVSEGTVEVATGLETASTAKAQPASSVVLKERGVVNYRDSIEHIEYVEPEKIEHKLAWKTGKIAFKGETLEHVIAETNRYTQQKLEIADPSIAQVRIGGYFDVGDMDQLLNLFKGSFGIEVIHTKDNVLYLASTANLPKNDH